ncbi:MULTISPECIES: amino acid--[acyl-carrier-protein] ligase [Tsukamurella]|uniref:Amino acid--[acyl-carrier-protein] ligase n=1 Tax=Tsukamurella strandjordii TaxID=147577 RepID=A0AA90NF41_9ACTN|nr:MULTISPECIES: amino acid--[acyl-carrier-protein] ligase [Tsukamurella]MDP0397256.1 amino acid--[acyl-carrier-protein] ligase [Tsukamurella strandjordii]GIZ98679.1 amino acid--[acyl-carrier-protein] ligase [Tsukamurella sp. TY48]
MTLTAAPRHSEEIAEHGGSGISPLDELHEQFRTSLFDAGHLVPTGIDGVYGRGAEFEKLVTAVDALVADAIHEVHGGAATVLAFPPVMPRQILDSTDYIASFPHLSGAVATYSGGDAEHRLLLAGRAAGHDWGGYLRSSELALVPSACHPVFPTLTGTLPRDGAWVDVSGYCFRNEPSADPTRLQTFRMHEIVRVGTERAAIAHRDSWVARAADLLTDLGLTVESTPAVDPFFGRGGAALAADQRADDLKTELVVRIYGDDQPGVAVASSNYHRDHFGAQFGITTVDGAVAHSACLGFGIERVALALLATHGLERATWPGAVNAQL